MGAPVLEGKEECTFSLGSPDDILETHLKPVETV